MIYQSGYLTIKAYDRDTESYLLDIPNNEVREGLELLYGVHLVGANFSSKEGTVDDWKEDK